MERTAMAWPVKPAKTQEEIGSIAQLFKDRPDEYRESRRALGISLERAYHQPTPMGDFVLAYVESEAGPGPTIAQMVGSDRQLDKDFARMVNEVHGIDITAPPAGPAPETIGVWTDPDVKTRGRGLAFCAPGIPGTADAGRAFIQEAFVT